MLSTRRDIFVLIFFCFCLTSGQLDVAVTEAQVVTYGGRVEVLLHQLVCGGGVTVRTDQEGGRWQRVKYGGKAVEVCKKQLIGQKITYFVGWSCVNLALFHANYILFH